MNDVTPPQAAEAVTAAAVAIHDADCPDTGCSGSALGHCYWLAEAALAKAGPLIRADERKHIRQASSEFYGPGFAGKVAEMLSILDRPQAASEQVPVMCALPGCHPGEHPYDPAVCGEQP